MQIISCLSEAVWFKYLCVECKLATHILRPCSASCKAMWTSKGLHYRKIAVQTGTSLILRLRHRRSAAQGMQRPLSYVSRLSRSSWQLTKCEVMSKNPIPVSGAAAAAADALVALPDVPCCSGSSSSADAASTVGIRHASIQYKVFCYHESRKGERCLLCMNDQLKTHR